MTLPVTRRGRLAPSPTGAQHLGNARTFLLAYWSAMATGTSLVLRIEDIDSPRVKPWATQQAIEDLRWLGIQWDGEAIVQTQRVARYDTVLDRLRHQNQIYPCLCTRRDIETAASAPHESTVEHEGAVYPGTCARWRHGDPIPSDRPLCWRYRVRPGVWAFDDVVSGDHSLDVAKHLGDFPVTRKSDMTSAESCYPPAAYQLAAVVDDIDQAITDVVRGDDLVASTLRQLQLFDSLGERPPRFAHVPLVRGADGRRLAKRHGDTRLSQYREQGVAPEAIVRWAARVSGLRPDDVPSGASLSTLHATFIEQFDWDRLPPESVQVDAANLF